MVVVRRPAGPRLYALSCDSGQAVKQHGPLCWLPRVASERAPRFQIPCHRHPDLGGQLARACCLLPEETKNEGVAGANPGTPGPRSTNLRHGHAAAESARWPILSFSLPSLARVSVPIRCLSRPGLSSACVLMGTRRHQL